MSFIKKFFADKKRIVMICLLLLLMMQLSVLCLYGTRKSGFHEDEFYSYYTTNKTAGLFVNDRTWLYRDEFRNDFVVLSGEEFRYDVVKLMQSWDVHPPFYYYLLHTVCSLSTGIFSKWQGILVNLIAFVPCYFLLFYLVYSCMTAEHTKENFSDVQGKRALLLSFATCLFWGFGAAVISGVMFIRMYQCLTFFVLLCACLHIRALKKGKLGGRFYLPLAVTVFFGFMTQYYYIIFHFFIGVGFCILLLKKKQIKEIVFYGLSCAVGFAAAVLYYPASMSHIFRGYRGTEAVSEFSNAENTLGRLRFFCGLFDDYVMNDTLIIWLLLLCLLYLTVGYLKKKDGVKMRMPGAEPAALLLFAGLGYFFTISKTALLLGETSNRYQLPVYGILIFLLLYYVTAPIFFLYEKREGKRLENKEKKGIKWQCGVWGLLFAVLLILDITAMKQDKVFFLYEEEREMMAHIKENSTVPVVVFYNDASPDNVWRISDQLMEVPKVYLASQGNAESLTDGTIIGSDKLLVYVADYEDKEACLLGLISSNKNISTYREIGQKGLWTLYEVE